MTEPGRIQAAAPAPPPPRAMPAGQPIAASYGHAAQAPADSRARLRTAGVPRIVCWQLVLLTVVLTIGKPWGTSASVGFVALVVLVLSSVRIRGRWVYQWLFLSSKYLLRERDRELRGPGGTGGALLLAISPEAVGLVDTLDGDPVFMISRTAGITAVLQPKSAVPDPARLPPPESLLPPANEQAPAFAVQVVHHAGVGHQRPFRTWVALQALRTIEVCQDPDVQQGLVNAVRRVQRRLRRAGLPTTGLAENEFLGTIASLAHVTAGRSRVREQWRFWHSGGVSQATFRLDGWTALPYGVAPRMVHRLLTATPQAAVTIAVTASRSGESNVDACLRVAAAGPPALEHAVQVLTRLANEWGVGMARLDGRHLQGVAATLPIGIAV